MPLLLELLPYMRPLQKILGLLSAPFFYFSSTWSPYSVGASVVICVTVQSLISFHFLRVWGETIVPKVLDLFVFTASASTSFHAGLFYVCQGCVHLCAHGQSQSDVCVCFVTPNHPRVCEVLSGRPCCVRVIFCVRSLLLLITAWGRGPSRQIEGM